MESSQNIRLISTRRPNQQEQVTVQLDPDILEWLKAQGKSYQTRITAILRAYVESQKERW